MRQFLLLFIVLLQSLSTLHASAQLTDVVFPRTDPKVVGSIYQMLQVIDLIFSKHKITYWIDGGTVLGYIRHGGLIPWDDDADLVHLIEDKERIWALSDEFASYGYHLRFDEIFRLSPLESPGYPSVDIGGYTYYDDGTLRFAHEEGRLFYINFYWLPEEVESLARVPFGPVTVNAPSHMMRYIFTGYGDDCLTKATFQRHHGGILSHVSIKEKVSIVNFSPAPYEMPNTTPAQLF